VTAKTETGSRILGIRVRALGAGLAGRLSPTAAGMRATRGQRGLGDVLLSQVQPGGSGIRSYIEPRRRSYGITSLGQPRR
jgi:hypothetical protein